MAVPASFARVLAEVSPERLAEVCGEDPRAECQRVLDWTGNEFLARTAGNVFIPLIQVIIIWVVAITINRLVRRLIKRVGHRMEGAAESEAVGPVRSHTPHMWKATASVSIRKAARAKTTTAVLRSLSTFLVYSVAILYTLNVIGVELGPLFAGAGIVGIALSFGAQSMVSDFIGGMFMLIEDQFGVGDLIDLSDSVGDASGVIGTVEEVTLRITKIRDLDGTIWHVPNGEIRRVGNMSQDWARALLDVPVPYGTDLADAQRIVTEVAHHVAQAPEYRPDVLAEPEVWGVEELTADAVVIRMVIQTRPGEQWAVGRALRAELHDAFVAAGIRHPFAQRDVYLHGAPGPVAVGPENDPS